MENNLKKFWVIVKNKETLIEEPKFLEGRIETIEDGWSAGMDEFITAEGEFLSFTCFDSKEKAIQWEIDGQNLRLDLLQEEYLTEKEIIEEKITYWQNMLKNIKK